MEKIINPPVGITMLIILFAFFHNSIIAQTITIGTQTWCTKNLNVAYFRNGDPIPLAKTGDEWAKASLEKKPAWCYYEGNAAYGAEYGKLYNWFAVNDPRGLAPEGFHIPSDEEWTVLSNYLGGESSTRMKLKSDHGWKGYRVNQACTVCTSWDDEFRSVNTCKTCFDNRIVNVEILGNGNNLSGFAGLPGGYRSNIENKFANLGENASWWSTSEDDVYLAWGRYLYHDSERENKNRNFRGSGGNPKIYGFSVRCLSN